MRRVVVVGALLVSCGPTAPKPPTASSAATTPTEPAATKTTTMTPEQPTSAPTFVDLALTLAPGVVPVADTRESDPSPIPGAAPSVEYFRSYGDGGEPFLFLFTWDGMPSRDRGPMQAAESWKLSVAGLEVQVSRTSVFFGQGQEVLVAHFEGPAPAKRRYMIYTKRVDRPAFEAFLQGIRAAPKP